MQLQKILQDFMQGWVQASKEPFTAHPTATLFRQDFCAKIAAIVKAFDPLYEVKASVGAGNWANVLGYQSSIQKLPTQPKKGFIRFISLTRMAQVFIYL
ncbi:MrcB family domain-containing protein [Rouxiella chamberiensis]|uniref:DUF3578 domain-containing protein n=1 Tax=Rouxiella chamberiensis TaxID=1513468 RepID=A0ABY7HMS8_9GAMM|nr:DUF3578 domain-containing protein [Rouxiella chamberiensis]WAT00548.1 DUF3578 domain-containing protein [Rouxiella chamberiensis]